MRGLIGSIDLVQILFTLFWVFFIGLVIYLRREDKREGYPLESDRSRRAGRVPVRGFPAPPTPKTFALAGGGTRTVPRQEAAAALAAAPVAPFPGAPLAPTGDPMRDGVGPAAWANRANVPDMTHEGKTRIVPLRAAAGYRVESRDPDPRGMAVIAGDGRSAGEISDVWVDRAEPQVRYLEVQLAQALGSRKVLVPIGFARISKVRRRVKVRALHAKHFAGVPALSTPDSVTRLEEDRISAYYAGGTLYATPARQEPLL